MTIRQAELFASDSHGIFIPQHFAESYNKEQWKDVDPKDIEILLTGPDHENYWDAWESVINDAETVCGGILYQDGDLWVIWPDLAIDAINGYCQEYLEYEESNIDAGNNYSHMVSESWCDESESNLMRQLDGSDIQEEAYSFKYIPKWSIDPMGLDPDDMSNIALEIFEMRPGHIFSNMESNFIVLDSFHIQEVEIDVSGLNIDQITMDIVRESCEPYISGTDLAYLTSDCVWYAVVDPVELQKSIKERVDS